MARMAFSSSERGSAAVFLACFRARLDMVDDERGRSVYFVYSGVKYEGGEQELVARKRECDGMNE